MNPAEFLTISSAVVPERAALISGDGARRLTYADMSARVNRLAGSLRRLGVERGDRVAVMATNSIEVVETYYACAKLGACFVPLNYRAKREEIAYMLGAAEASLLFVGQRYLELLATLRPALPRLREVVALEGGDGELTAYESLVARGNDEEIFTEVDEDEPTVMLFTSGTTALPKGVELTYLNLSLYVMNTMGPADPSASSESTLLSVGVYHVAGLTTIMSSIWGGRSLVLLPQFEPQRWLEAVEREGVTHAFVVPTMLKRIMEQPGFERYDFGSLRLLTYGAAPMPFDVVCRAIEVFSCDLMNAYGQTESTSALSYLAPDDHRLDGTEAENAKKLHRLRSVGRPMDDVRLAVLDGEGRALPSGAEGEVCVQSARVMKEYVNQAAETAAAVQDGWLHTGDVGFLDEDGYLFVTGRIKDLINRGGEKITAAAVEIILDEHELVDESAVIAVPDPEWGETVKAVVVLNPAGKEREAQVVRDELRVYCRERLASFKAPAYVAFVAELPRNPMGKVLKTELRRDHGAADDD